MPEYAPPPAALPAAPPEAAPTEAALPPELEQAAIQADAAEEQAFSAAAPTGDFTTEGLNALVDSVNEVLPVFGTEGDYPVFSEDVDRLPSEFVKVLTMISQAVKEAGITDLDFSLDEITDDTDLIRVAGRLRNIAENPEFARFLRAPVEGGPSAAVPTKPSAAPAPPTQPAMSEGQTDALFASRA